MARNSERLFQSLKVKLFSSWFAFACIWTVIWYLGFRLKGVVWEPGFMDVASGLSPLEIVGVIFAPPLSVLAAGYMLVTFLGQMRQKRESGAIGS